PRLPDDHGQRDDEAGVEAQPHRGHERLADRERGPPPVPLRQRRGEEPDQVAVKDVRDDEPDEDRADADEEPLPQLLEMLDERRLLTVPEATRETDRTHGALGDGFVLAGRCGRGRVLRPHRQLRRLRRLGVSDFRVFGLAVARDRVLELAHPGPERPSDLRQALRSEEQEGDDQQEDDLGRADVRHAPTLAAFWAFSIPGKSLHIWPRNRLRSRSWSSRAALPGWAARSRA